MTEMDFEAELTPIQRVHVFLWDIYNIIRNLNILKQWLQVNYKKQPIRTISLSERRALNSNDILSIQATNPPN
jgi:hypothetical protein